MSGAHDAAVEAMHALLAELPYEFSANDPATKPITRESFQVIKSSNCRKVHQALWDLQVHLRMQKS